MRIAHMSSLLAKMKDATNLLVFVANFQSVSRTNSSQSLLGSQIWSSVGFHLYCFHPFVVRPQAFVSINLKPYLKLNMYKL